LVAALVRAGVALSAAVASAPSAVMVTPPATFIRAAASCERIPCNSLELLS
jgi:hypothetical protein